MSEDSDDQNGPLFEILRHGGAVVDAQQDDDGNIDANALARDLAAAINAIPPVWIRKKNDPEWSTLHWLNPNQIAGALLAGIMRSIPTEPEAGAAIPDDLTGLARFIKHELHTLVADKQVSLCEVGALLWERCQEHPGFTAGGFDREVAVHNALIALRDELRESARFDREFEAKWKRRHGKGGNTDAG